MPYFPPGGEDAASSARSIYIIAEDLSPGNLTLSDDGYWGAVGPIIQTISVQTASTDWSLYLCEADDFNISLATSKHLANSAIEDAIIEVSSFYNSLTSSVYLKYEDNAGSNVASFT